MESKPDPPKATAEWRECFAHRQLQQDHVRLLKVDLTNDSPAISLSIEHFHKDNLPEYYAVSYTWGERPHQYREILLDDRPFQVTANAYWCLHFICKHYRRWQYLWMDSICINQVDIAERNAQVQRMDQIYQRATLVLAWLGSDQHIDGDTWSTKARRRRYVSKKEAIYDLPYWRRIWIVKEIYFARDVLFLYGPVESTLAEFRGKTTVTFDLINTLIWDTDLKEGPHGVMTMYALTAQKHRLGDSLKFPGWPRDLTLLTSWFWFKSHHCCDPRDRVFSVMGLFPAHERQALEIYFPDYRISMEKFWLIVFAHLLLWHGRCKNLMYDGSLGINIGGRPRETLRPTRSIFKALQPMLTALEQTVRSKAPSRRWRRPSWSRRSSEAPDDETLNDERCAQEALMYRIIADFAH